MSDYSSRRDWVENLVLRHENRLYRTAVAMMGNKADAEDIVQEVFMKVVQSQPDFASEQHETAWLVRVTANLCKSRLRSTWWKKTEPLLESYPAGREAQHELLESILSLPPRYRAVIHLFYYEGYATAEIAQITEQKESTVRSLLTRARQRLKTVLKEEEAL